MNNIALIVKLRELLVIFMHTRTLPEKAADALRYCGSISRWLKFRLVLMVNTVIFLNSLFLSDEKSRTAPDDLLRSGGDLILSILMLYEHVASGIAVEEFMHKQNRFNG